MSAKSFFAAITPTSVDPGTIMFVHPQQAAATQLAGFITPQLVHDLYESLPAGAVTEDEVHKLMHHVKTYLLTGQGLSDSFGYLAGLVTASTAPPASAAAGHELAGLITGAMVKDLIILVAPTVSAGEVKAAISLLKTDLNAGLGIAPWLQADAAAFGGYGAGTAHHVEARS